MFHFSSGPLEFWLADLLQLTACLSRHYGYKLRLGVVASCLYLLVVLDDHTIDIVGGGIAE